MQSCMCNGKHGQALCGSHNLCMGTIFFSKQDMNLNEKTTVAKWHVSELAIASHAS